MIIQPGPVVDFLIANQNVRDPFSLDWAKVIMFFNICLFAYLIFNYPHLILYSTEQAKRTLKNLRIKASPSNQEYKITGLSELPCKEQT